MAQINSVGWIKEIHVVDVIKEGDDQKVNHLLRDGWQIVNQRVEKIRRYNTAEVQGKVNLVEFDVMMARFIMGK